MKVIAYAVSSQNNHFVNVVESKGTYRTCLRGMNNGLTTDWQMHKDLQHALSFFHTNRTSEATYIQ